MQEMWHVLNKLQIPAFPNTYQIKAKKRWLFKCTNHFVVKYFENLPEHFGNKAKIFGVIVQEMSFRRNVM